jgi:hypothetical protein
MRLVDLIDRASGGGSGMPPLRRRPPMTQSAKKSSETGSRTSVRKRGRAAAACPASRAAAVKPNGSTPLAIPAPTKPISKRQQLAAMLVRDQGATIAQMQDATGWLPHTVRAALTGLKKLGYAIDSDKVEGLRTYRAVAPE